jgi:hypothetical protein
MLKECCYLFDLGAEGCTLVAGVVFIILVQLVTLHLRSDEILNFLHILLLLFLNFDLGKHVSDTH